MSLGTYNRTPANRKPIVGEQIHARADMYASMTSIMGAGIAINLSESFEGAMNAAAEMRHGYDTKLSYHQDMSAKAKAQITIEWKMNANAELGASMNRLLNDKIHMAGNLRADVPLTMWIYPTRALYGEMKLALNSLQTKETSMHFADITIPPNGIVVIDSEYFTATLNGENIIDLYDGEWPELTSRLKAMEVQGISSGELQVAVLYRERYL